LIAVDVVPPTFVISLVSQYDAYLADVLRVVLAKQPSLLDSSEKKLSYSELLSFPSLDDARNEIAEREIDTLMRDSHADQIAWLERRLSIPLTKDLAIWPEFIEITERRNLFVHTGGRVTPQYITSCQKHGAVLPDVAIVGELLSVEPDYFVRACDVILELGVKLGHVLWRKTAEDERIDADQNLNMICYHLIHSEEYEMAIELLTFATETIKKHGSEELYLYMLLNKAQAHKWSGHQEMCNNIIASIDWSAKASMFKLVCLVLRDEFDKAGALMKLIGDSGEIKVFHYMDWPVFREFRLSQEFLQAFREVFGAEFSIKQTTSPPPATGPLPQLPEER
jgi:hypothetical protein